MGCSLVRKLPEEKAVVASLDTLNSHRIHVANLGTSGVGEGKTFEVQGEDGRYSGWEGSHESRRRDHCYSVCGIAALGHDDKASMRGTYYHEVDTHVLRLPVSGAGTLLLVKKPITYLGLFPSKRE